jgi:hypothetical protein
MRLNPETIKEFDDAWKDFAFRNNLHPPVRQESSA